MSDIHTSPAYEYKNGSTPETGTKANGEKFNEEFLRLYSNDVWIANNKLLRSGGEVVGSMIVKHNLICSIPPRETLPALSAITPALSKVADMELYKETAYKPRWKIYQDYIHNVTMVQSAYHGGVYSPTQNRIYLVPAGQAPQTQWHYIQEFSAPEIAPQLAAHAMFNKL